MRLIDRASGSVIASLLDGVGEVFADSVEDVQGFEVGELFLNALLQQPGLEGAQAVLAEAWADHGDLTLGLEPLVDERGGLTGLVRDQNEEPVGGLVLTAQGPDEEAVTWAFTRPDGSFRLALGPELRVGVELLLASRGGLYLAGYDLGELPGEVKRLEPFTVSVVSGLIRTEGGEPLVEGRVESWGSWATTDTNGRFRLPVERLGEMLDLEVFAASGQPLGGYWRVEPDLEGDGQIGERTVPVPAKEWPSADGPLLAGTEEVRPLFSTQTEE